MSANGSGLREVRATENKNFKYKQNFKLMENNQRSSSNPHLAKPVLCDGFLIPMTDFVLRINYIEKEIDQFFDSWRMKQLRIIENYATFLKQPLKLEMFVPCDEDGNVLEDPKIEEEYVDEHTTQIFAQYQYDLDKAKEKVLFEGFKIYDYKLNVFFYLGRRKILSYDKKRKDFITIGLLPETVEDLINISSQIKLSQTALNSIFGETVA